MTLQTLIRKLKKYSANQQAFFSGPTEETDLIDEAVAALREFDRKCRAKAEETVKTGVWKHLGGDEWCCSVCGHVVSTEGSWEHPHERGKLHCENCGAKLERECRR